MQKLSEKNYRRAADNCASAACAADASQTLDKKETQAIDFIRAISRNITQPLYLAYSGGKDSDIIYHLAKKAKVPFVGVYNNTTIDRPGTIAHVKYKDDIKIIQPRRTFFQLIEHRGLPSTFQRICCAKLKELYIGQHVITGVRAAESTPRRLKYKEPTACFVHKSGRTSQRYMPILFWSDNEVEEYIAQEAIKCHPWYYEPDGTFCVKKRVGCLGCPMPEQRGIQDFVRYPKLLRRWCQALSVYRNTRPVLGTTITYYRDEYENMYHNLFNKRITELIEQQQTNDRDFARMKLQNYFNIELPPPQSPLEELIKTTPLKPATQNLPR